MTREEWLNEVAGLMNPWFAEMGFDVPKIRVSVGFPSTGARGKRIGECWSKECSADGVYEIFLHPNMDEPTRVAGVLAHEIVHAVVGIEAGHGPKFRKVATSIGLEGKMTATTEGRKFLDNIAPILEKVGVFPHKKLSGQTTAKKKQSTRLVKCECSECGYIARTTQKWIEETGEPVCPCNFEPMKVAAQSATRLNGKVIRMKIPQYIDPTLAKKLANGTIDPAICKRILVEGKIMYHVARKLIGYGYAIRVLPGREDDGLPWMTDAKEIMHESMACDEDIWCVGSHDGNRVGAIYFVQGNDGWDVISDWSWRENAFGKTFNDQMEEISKYADKFDTY